MNNGTSRTDGYAARVALVPIPTGVTPLPVRSPPSDQQPAPHHIERMLHAMTIAFGSYGFTAMRIFGDRGTTNRQLLTIKAVVYRPQCDTSLSVTIEHTRRYGLLAVACWTLRDGRALRRESKPFGFELDATTTSISLARRIAHTLAAYEARVCAMSVANDHKRTA
jgi:hypothetical protein